MIQLILNIPTKSLNKIKFRNNLVNLYIFIWYFIFKKYFLKMNQTVFFVDLKKKFWTLLSSPKCHKVGRYKFRVIANYCICSYYFKVKYVENFIYYIFIYYIFIYYIKLYIYFHNCYLKKFKLELNIKLNIGIRC